MTRLPQSGRDNGVWGDILNDFLTSEHNPSGTLKIRTDGTLDAYYQKPSSGIPKSDLATDVQTTLSAATTAINVKAYGAMGNGTTDDTAAIQAAIDAVPSTGAAVFLPRGTYVVSSTLTIDKDATMLIGAGASSVIRVPSGALGIDLIKIGNGSTTRAHCGIRDLRITADGQKTAGCGVHLDKCFKIWLKNLLIEKQYRSLQFTNTTEVWLDSTDVRDTKEHGLLIDNDLMSGFDWYINNCVFDNPDVTNIGSGIHWDGGETLVASNVDLLRFNTGLYVKPTAGRESRFGFLNNLIMDTSRDNNVRISNADTGNTVGLTFTNCWSGTAPNYGVLIDKPGSGLVQGVRWIGGKVFHNGLAGFRLAGGQDVHISDCDIIANSQTISAARHGVEVSADVNEFSVKGCRIGGGYGQGDTQGYAIHIDPGTSDHYIIVNNDCHGNNNTPKINDNGTGVNKIVSGNLEA
ncbi:MAG TPA: glycosyl hydrolase family 28-related protein [Candidatus Saccharimonadales bacterium]